MYVLARWPISGGAGNSEVALFTSLLTQLIRGIKLTLPTHPTHTHPADSPYSPADSPDSSSLTHPAHPSPDWVRAWRSFSHSRSTAHRDRPRVKYHAECTGTQHLYSVLRPQKRGTEAVKHEERGMRKPLNQEGPAAVQQQF